MSSIWRSCKHWNYQGLKNFFNIELNLFGEIMSLGSSDKLFLLNLIFNNILFKGGKFGINIFNIY